MANYIGNQPLAGEFKHLDSIASQFNGGSVTFSLLFNSVSQSAGDASQLIVSLNGVIQEPLTSYTLGSGGSTITFSSAPANGDTCFIVMLGGVGGTTTPSDNSVTTAKIASGAVTSAKLDTNISVSGTTNIGSYVGSAVNSPLDIKSDTSHFGLSIEENSGTETWQLGVDVDGDLNFHNSGSATPSVTFDDSGHVGIGTAPSNPDGFDRILQVHGTNSAVMRFTGSTYGVGATDGVYMGFSYGGFEIVNPRTTGYTRFQMTGGEAMRINSNGHVLIGTTDAGVYDDATDEAGHNLLANGQYYNSTDNEINMILNRQNVDGDIVQLRNDGAPVGSIGSNTTAGQKLLDIFGTQNLRIVTNGSERLRIDSTGDINLVSSSSGLINLNFTDSGLNDYARIEGGKSGSGVGDLRFHVYSGGLSEAVRINSNGRVGIGSPYTSSANNLTLHNASSAELDIDCANGKNFRISSENDSAFKITDKDTNDVRLTIDSTGRVLVGTTNADVGGSVTGIALKNTGAILSSTDGTSLGAQPLYADRRGTNNEGDVLMLALGGFYKSSIGVIGTNSGSDNGGITFSTIANNVTKTERMRITSAGSLLVGVESSSVNMAGLELAANGQLYASTSSSSGHFFNSQSNGPVVSIRAGGYTVGSIGGLSSRMYVGTGDTGLFFNDQLDSIDPWNTSTNSARDAAIDIGDPSRRFKDLHLSGKVYSEIIGAGDAGLLFNHHSGSLDGILPYNLTTSTLDNGNIDLGGTANKFRSIYLSGGVYVGGHVAANHLDDYEEGTWTPTTPSGSWSIQDAKYVKVGRLVTCFFNIDITSTVSASDFAGLPFTPSQEAAGIVGYQNHISGEVMAVYVQAANIWNLRVGSTQYGMGNGKTMRGSFAYHTNS